jgi:hypothetical protein
MVMSGFVAQVVASIRALARVWESLQVELHGQYSLARLSELSAFARRAGVLHSLAIAASTPLACVAITILTDMLPLRPPTNGIFNQSATYWIRAYVTLIIVSGVATLHVWYSSPRLRMRWGGFAVAIALVAFVTTLVYLVYHVVIGFPTPFTIQLVGPIWLVFLLTAILALWGTPIRTDPEVQRDLKQFNAYVLSQFSMTTIYPVMIYAFGTLNGTQQTVFSISFPVVKLMLKNSASRGVYNLEDLAPVFVVLGVDVFHALLLSGAMRTATSLGTYLSVMATDVFQNIVAVAQVRMTMNQLKRLRLEIREAQATPSCVRDPLDHTDVFTYATSLLESHPHLRVDPSIALPRHQRQLLSRPLNVARHVSLRLRSVRLSSLRGRFLAAVAKSQIVPVHSEQKHHAPPTTSGDQTLSTQKITPELEYVRLSLALLHMIECYVLVEFTEVIVSIIYGTHGYIHFSFGLTKRKPNLFPVLLLLATNLAATFHLPNRDYYLFEKTLTRDQLIDSVVLVLQYAALELLSLILLCVVLDRLVGMSTLRLLAFTLWKHALLAQTLLVMWVYIATQFTLEHFGNDYTFRFQWLRHPEEHK